MYTENRLGTTFLGNELCWYNFHDEDDDDVNDDDDVGPGDVYVSKLGHCSTLNNMYSQHVIFCWVLICT